MALKNEGFLTDEQREVLKIAVQSAEGLSSSPKSPSSMLNDHNFKAPTAGVRVPTGETLFVICVGRTRKTSSNGAGGKGTWGKLLDTDTDTHIDKNDPNYDSGEEPYELVGATVSSPVDDYKKAVVSIIEEYFSTGDVDQAASDLRDLHSDEYHHYFVKKLVSMAMDRHDKEKEMSTVLLSALYADVINSAHINKGFLMLLESADDLTLDIVDTVDVLALFIARAVVDDILPPAFLKRAREKLSETSKGFQVIQTAEKSYLSAPHHAELVERRWVKKKIVDLLREYTENGDTTEACRCIRELGVSFFHHEVVKRAIILAMEVPASELLILRLLKEAAEEGLISSSQMAKGFLRLAEALDDLSLDIPSAKPTFQSLVPRAISEGWLEPSFLKSTAADTLDVDVDVDVDVDDKKLRRYKEEAVAIIHEKNREKEMTSVLLSALHTELFSTEDIVNGFIMLLKDAEDTALDILDASNELAFFLARAVIDDTLVPLNLVEIGGRLPPGGSGSETIHMARTLISARHAGERLLRCWGGGSGWAVEDAKDKITKLLEEYESGGTLVRPAMVKKALIMDMEKKNSKNSRILSLLQECFSEGLITTNQMTKGFSRVRDALEDLALDIPDAGEKFLSYTELARARGWLLPAFPYPSLATPIAAS
ncbi:unnamed protein product [Spirodela intermedia]|uniref:MI domain-containing protein n=1 Tax=Spirodela intermedia TaxID=51605 RepID=A0A7I8INV8_SPIIN|nr:unnamed protein product [Spirodela intermedia]CAA6659627.1 unnamed protein product [Spirodela intermedia]